MKNKKPKTIEEIVLLNVEFGAKNKKVWVSKIVPQIKQLIADEVIGEGEGRSIGNINMVEATDNQIVRNTLRKQQCKKLERL